MGDINWLFLLKFAGIMCFVSAIACPLVYICGRNSQNQSIDENEAYRSILAGAVAPLFILGLYLLTSIFYNLVPYSWDILLSWDWLFILKFSGYFAILFAFFEEDWKKILEGLFIGLMVAVGHSITGGLIGANF